MRVICVHAISATPLYRIVRYETRYSSRKGGSRLEGDRKKINPYCLLGCVTGINLILFHHGTGLQHTAYAVQSSLLSKSQRLGCPELEKSYSVAWCSLVCANSLVGSSQIPTSAPHPILLVLYSQHAASKFADTMLCEPCIQIRRCTILRLPAN